ncbi:uncharacterized protein LOC105381494 isoform X1 [Plutella xylostella]|uniref:uncharacterized protein LOC105381494 isoform X1 n=1 Tax=Plutella xylostella TaxID=51655 RepID=UPI0020328C36|nr:uncharacterized protein LOC105381494 isoform X1 [Plutella xylostella]XP_048488112.1 uncharacterized protein LOC105381494 isoform X1 [Plutella xylostella]XP_048488113.1 uncharacterized protein LOC105381494 isoform X1 [Plutella xylostella]
MPELVEQMYCSQQIVIPPKFPYILKRYAKAAIKTQPYDLLRWSYEYFSALAEHRPPPVKLRLEYPVFSTEGGLTRGYLKVLACQLEGMSSVPLPRLQAVWEGSCLDVQELSRILCLCEARAAAVPRLHFLAVAAGMLTKSLTHTMILLCELLTHEPEGGSAAIDAEQFLMMYRFLAPIDASATVKYYNGYREGTSPPVESVQEEQEEEEPETTEVSQESSAFWNPEDPLHRLSIMSDKVSRSVRISGNLEEANIRDKHERSPSVERAIAIERDKYLRERKIHARPSSEVDKQLRELNASKLIDAEGNVEESREEAKSMVEVTDEEGVQIRAYNEEGEPLRIQFYGEPDYPDVQDDDDDDDDDEPELYLMMAGGSSQDTATKTEAEVVAEYVAESYKMRDERRADLEQTFEEIKEIVKQFHSANYDYGMVSGRQMSTTSAEFVARQLEADMMETVYEQIDDLPDPALRRKKAKAEDVEMIRSIVEEFIDENLHVFVPEVEEVEEEVPPVPEVIVVYAVPGIGPPVPEDIVEAFTRYAEEAAREQEQMIMPRNLRHFLCPPLEVFEEHDYENEDKEPMEENIPFGGVLTD